MAYVKNQSSCKGKSVSVIIKRLVAGLLMLTLLQACETHPMRKRYFGNNHPIQDEHYSLSMLQQEKIKRRPVICQNYTNS